MQLVSTRVNGRLVVTSVGAAGPQGPAGLATGVEGVAALRDEPHQDTPPSVAFLLYVTTPGDGGQGMFFWSASETRADDGTSVIRDTAIAYPTAGAWVRLS